MRLATRCRTIWRHAKTKSARAAASQGRPRDPEGCPSPAPPAGAEAGRSWRLRPGDAAALLVRRGHLDVKTQFLLEIGSVSSRAGSRQPAQNSSSRIDRMRPPLNLTGPDAIDDDGGTGLFIRHSNGVCRSSIWKSNGRPRQVSAVQRQSGSDLNNDAPNPSGSDRAASTAAVAQPVVDHQRSLGCLSKP